MEKKAIAMELFNLFGDELVKIYLREKNCKQKKEYKKERILIEEEKKKDKAEVNSEVFMIFAEKVVPSIEKDKHVEHCLVVGDYEGAYEIIKYKFYSSLHDRFRSRAYEKIRKIIAEYSKMNCDFHYRAGDAKTKIPGSFAFIDKNNSEDIKNIHPYAINDVHFNGWFAPEFVIGMHDNQYAIECLMAFWDQYRKKHKKYTPVYINDFLNYMKNVLPREIYSMYAQEIDSQNFMSREDDEEGSSNEICIEDVAALDGVDPGFSLLGHEYADAWARALREEELVFFCLWFACAFGPTELCAILGDSSPQNAYAKIKKLEKRFLLFASLREGLAPGDGEEEIFRSFSASLSANCQDAVLGRECHEYSRTQEA